jgi:hypothetical protein
MVGDGAGSGVVRRFGFARFLAALGDDSRRFFFKTIIAFSLVRPGADMVPTS